MSADVKPVALPAFAAFHWDAGFECWEHVTTVNADDVGVIWAVDSAVAQSAIDALTARIAELEREAVELRKDAGRLDYLNSTGEAYGFQDLHEGNRWLVYLDGPFSNIRQSIDAAIAAKEQP